MVQEPERILHQLQRRPTKIIVDLAALRHNVAVVRRHVAPARILASVKADAYGHGLIPCCKAFAEAGVDYLGVAFVEEAIILRDAGISIPILVFGGLSDDQIRTMLEYDLEITASSVDKLHAIDRAAKALNKTARVHLKIDTGMERIGTHYYSADALLRAAAEAESTTAVGVYSHFATADSPDLTFAREQLHRFQKVISFYPQHGLPTPMVHMANSGALLQLPESRFDMVRPGITLYGEVPESHLQGILDLRPGLSLISSVVYFKVVKAGSTVSYGQTWTASRDTRVVTVPIGYGDGFSRLNSNVGQVLIRGKRYPIVGRVCMDQLMVDIGDGEAYNGDEVVLIGSQGEETITAAEVAERTGTISYETLSALKLRIPRIYRDQ